MNSGHLEFIKSTLLSAESEYKNQGREGRTKNYKKCTGRENVTWKKNWKNIFLSNLQSHVISAGGIEGREKKQLFIRLSIILPLALIFYAQTESISFSIPELNIFLETNWARHLIIAIVVLWLCCSPYRKSCCNGSWIELLFNLVPIEIVLMLNLAQWNFVVFVIVSMILIASELLLFIKLKNEEKKFRITNRSHRAYKTLYRRCMVAIMAVCLIPGLPFLLSHGMSAPTYQAEQELPELYSTSDSEEGNGTAETKSDTYQNKKLWNCFKEKNWKKYSLQKKLDVMQELTNFETRLLRIPDININAGMIGAYTLGYYNDETNEIFINTKHLDRSSVEECIGTICHEVRHSLQYQIVKSVDWNNSIFQTPYFDELRSWRDNQESYKNVWVYGVQEYEDQPLETDARNYEKNETAKIMSYVRD